MKKVVLFYTFFILLLPVVSGQSIITIDVHEDGNAVWTMEKHLPLATQAEIEDWEEFTSQGQDSSQYTRDIEEFRRRINGFIGSAAIVTNRSMAAENFSLSYDTSSTISSTFGIVRFRFEWIGFSKIGSGNILIGDVFSEGLILTADDVLIIQLPDGYKIETIAPKYDTRDGDRLVWDGTQYRSFDTGEPALVLAPESKDQGIWYLLIIVLLGGAALYIIKRNPASDVQREPTHDPEKRSDDLAYEEMIEQILTRSGGQVYQSEIVQEIGLSKSKISILLSQMKEEGRIIKIRRGKENIIRLNKK